jgi:NodT family efflux transporter outer membrane factor (OMF) lipoprotein
VGPEYAGADLTAVTDAVWAESGSTQLFEHHALKGWWTRFGDPDLAALLERSMTGSLELAAARERIVAVRARRGIANADRLPSLDAAADYTRRETGSDAPVPPNFPGQSEGDLFTAGALASWEIDLWGRVARLVDEADARIGVAEEDFRAARLSLAAEVATEVLLIRALDDRAAVVRRSIKLDADSVAIARARAGAGSAGELDLARSERTAAANRAALEPLAADRRAAEHRIAGLLGVRAGAVDVPVRATPDAPALPGLGLPADLVARRPDIRLAERELAVSVARVGSATAEKYPRVTLAGSFVLGGTDAGDVFSMPTRVLSVGPSVTLPVFRGGRIRAAIAEAESESRQAMIRLEQRVLGAIGGVETALVRQGRADRRVELLREAAEAAADAEKLAASLYRAGRTDFLTVLEAQSERLQIDDLLAQAVLERNTQTVNLFRALGGGWDEGISDPAMAPLSLDR